MRFLSSLASHLWRSLISLTAVDEKTEVCMARDYKMLPMIVGIYPYLRLKYIPLVFIQFASTYLSLILHFYLFFNSTIELLDINFTLASFHFQLCLLILFTIFLLTGVVLARPSMNVLHGEMIYEIFKYERENLDILGRLSSEIAKEKKVLLSVPLTVALAATNVLAFAPVLDNFFGDFRYNGTKLQARSWDLPVNMVWHPLTEGSSLGFYVAILLQIHVAVLIVSIVGVAGLMFIQLNQLHCLHLKYLSYNVECLQERAEELYFGLTGKKLPESELYENATFLRCYKACLKRTFQHHQRILRWTGYFQDLTGIPIGLAYATGTIVIALSLLSIKTGISFPGTYLSSILLCLGEIGFMALLSFLGQRITDLSEDLRFKLYSTKWYNCDKSINLQLEIFQEVTLRPLKLVGFGLITASNDTFSNVMNSAYTYYNLIMAF
nr:olfactory receptor 23 [Tropidothorax elegans]